MTSDPRLSVPLPRSERATVHCPDCGRFASNVRCLYDLESIVDVQADCKVHGVVYPVRFFDGDEWGWSWEDFFAESESA